jgi:hypothetical protein
MPALNLLVVLVAEDLVSAGIRGLPAEMCATEAPSQTMSGSMAAQTYLELVVAQRALGLSGVWEVCSDGGHGCGSEEEDGDGKKDEMRCSEVARKVAAVGGTACKSSPFGFGNNDGTKCHVTLETPQFWPTSTPVPFDSACS